MEYRRLGDIATYINGYAFKPEQRGETGLPIIRIQDLTGNSYDLGYYDGEYPAKIEINNDDVLISWSASLGVYVWKNGKALLNQHIFKVVFDKCQVDKRFFVYQVKSILEKYSSQAHGATMKHLTKPVFDALPFYYPPLDEQRHIAAVLDKAAALIDLRKQQLAKLDELVKARFVEMFGDAQNNKFGFKTSTLSDISEQLFAGGDKPSDVSSERTGEYLYPVYANGYENQGLQCYAKNYRVEKQSVTVSARGTIGYCFIRNPYYTPVVRLITIVPKSCISVEYLKYAIDNMEIGSSGSSQQQLTVPDFKKKKLVVPPMELQKQFAEFVKQIDKSKAAIQKSLDESQLLFDSQMQKYFG